MPDLRTGALIVRSALGYASLILVGVCVLAGCLQKPDTDLAGRVDEVFAEWDRSDSPGCALAVIRDGQIVYQRGYGMADLEHDVPIAPDSVFYIGSVSKQFVAMTLLLLEEQERLSLDDDIRWYLSDFPDRGLRTVRHAGALGGYRAQLLRFPDQRFSVIILSNLASIDPLTLAFETADIYLQKQLGVEAGSDDSVDESNDQGDMANADPSLVARDLNEYKGEFFSRELRTWYMISVRDGGLALKIDYSVERPLRAMASDHFVMNGSQIRFRRDATGQVTGFLLDSEGIEDLAFIKAPLSH